MADELYRYRGRGDGIHEPPYEHYESVGFTLDDVRRLARYAAHVGMSKNIAEIGPFRALLDGGKHG